MQSIEDWIQDFKQFLNDSPYSTALEDMYPGVHVHSGFLEQLQAVTDKAPNATQNIGNVLMDMSGGVPPSLVIVTGAKLLTKEAWALYGPKLSSRLIGVVFSVLFFLTMTMYFHMAARQPGSLACSIDKTDVSHAVIATML